ncbi:MAG: tetratricopeptide repeat protein [Bryobacteraceae bacterium]|jgi:tetratricopeptide (TPR) repeat protein
MERAFVVFLALASIAPAADLSDSQNLCPAEQSARDCAISSNNLGSTYFATGKFREAERLFTRAISLWATETAPSDDLAKAFHNLGAVYRAEGRNADAERFDLRALYLRESLSGSRDVSLLPILNELGLAYLEMADYVQAKQTLQRAVAIVQADHAEKTENGTDAFTAWGVLLETEGKNADAIQWLGKALALRETLAGPDSVPAADAANDLALAYRQQGDLVQAESLYRRAVAVYRHTSSPTSLVAVLNNLGRVLAEQSQYKEAEQFYREAISVAEQRLGPEHPEVAVGLGSLGKLMLARRKFSDAERLLQRAEQIDRQNFAENHPRIGYDLCNEAMVALGRRHYADAEALFKKSEEILDKSLPPDHPEIGKLVANLANVYRLQGRLDESEPLYRRALSILAQAWGPENPQLLATLQSYEAVLRARQEYAEAESVEVRSTKIRVVQALRDSN